jgi:hypothetical protein
LEFVFAVIAKTIVILTAPVRFVLDKLYGFFITPVTKLFQIVKKGLIKMKNRIKLKTTKVKADVNIVLTKK